MVVDTMSLQGSDGGRAEIAHFRMGYHHGPFSQALRQSNSTQVDCLNPEAVVVADLGKEIEYAKIRAN